MSDFGARLRAAREQRGTSLREIADKTKISRASLDALERGDLLRLPGGIFVRAFVRAYATEVGLDPEEMVRAFLLEHGEQADKPIVAARIPEEESGFESDQHVARVLLRIVVVSVPLVFLILYFTMRQRPAPSAPAQAATPVPVSGAPVAPAVHAPEPPAPSSATRETGAPGGAAPAVPATGDMELVIEAKAECWAEIVVDGRRALQRILQPGERETLQVHDSVVIRVGDAGAFAFSINGHEAKPLGASGEVRVANITRDSLASFLR